MQGEDGVRAACSGSVARAVWEGAIMSWIHSVYGSDDKREDPLILIVCNCGEVFMRCGGALSYLDDAQLKHWLMRQPQ